MSRNKSMQVSETLVESNEPQATESPMTGKAVGIAPDPLTGAWVTTVVEFNPSTGQARVLKTIASGLSKMEASEKFKIAAIEEGIVA